MEKRHVTSCYEKNQLHSLKSTQLELFDKVHVKQVSGPPTTSQVNDYNLFSPNELRREIGCVGTVYNGYNLTCPLPRIGVSLRHVDKAPLGRALVQTRISTSSTSREFSHGNS